MLENYCPEKRTGFTVTPDKSNHAGFCGDFRNKETFYKSGIVFEINTDMFYYTGNILNTLNIFFKELTGIQGNSNFY